MTLPTWGLVATIKAPLTEVLGFAAHHLDLGAHRLHIYLDDPAPETHAALKAHPKIRVHDCDANYWRKSGIERPKKHQLRQTHNATRAYARHPEVDWLIHIDVDEFLWPDTPVARRLADLPDDVFTARVRPIEALGGSTTYFKRFIPAGPERDRIVRRLYPQFGDYVKGGFLSHVAGKVFVRTGMENLTFRIHNVIAGEAPNPGQTEIADIALCHCHVREWPEWLASYRYRLEQGSYRAELAPVRPRAKGGLSLHETFTVIESEQGEAGLRAFFDEVCANSPKLRAPIGAESLLQRRDLDIAGKIRKHFPLIHEIVAISEKNAPVTICQRDGI